MPTNFTTVLNQLATKVGTGGYTAGSGTLPLATGYGAAILAEIAAEGAPAISPTHPIRVSVVVAAHASDSPIPATYRTIFRATGLSGDVLSGLTAIEGTTDRNYAVSDVVRLNLTAGAIAELQVAVNAAEATLVVNTTSLAGKAATVHTHDAADIISGTIDTARLGGGTANVNTFLRGDRSWQVVTAPAVFIASGASHASGLVPDPGSTAGTAKFLREDATFAVPPGTSNLGPYTDAAAPIRSIFLGSDHGEAPCWKDGSGVVRLISYAPITITITEPYAAQFYHSGTGGAAVDIPVSGTYAGGTPATIEASYDGATFVTLDAAPTGGTYSGTLTGVPEGDWTITVRWSDVPANTALVPGVRVGGLVLVLAGQSNMVGMGENLQAFTPSGGVGASLWNSVTGKWVNVSDPVGGTQYFSTSGGGNGSVWPLVSSSLVSSRTTPVAIIPTAVDGSNIASWQPGQANYTNMHAAAVAAGTSIDLFCFWQGESDAGTSPPTSGYSASLDALATQVNSDFPGCRTMVAILQDSSASGLPGLSALWAIERSKTNSTIYATGPDLSGIVVSTTPPEDGLHIKTDAHLATAASLWTSAILAATAPPVFVDTFNRADGAVGNNWSLALGAATFTIASNVLAAGGGSDSFITQSASAASVKNQRVEVTFVPVSTAPGLTVVSRWNPTTHSGYVGRYYADTFYILQCTSSTLTLIDSLLVGAVTTGIPQGVRFDVVSTDSTHTSLTLSLFDPATGLAFGTPLNVPNDATSGLQDVAGQPGVGQSFSAFEGATSVKVYDLG